jgi:hypothetical protein
VAKASHPSFAFLRVNAHIPAINVHISAGRVNRLLRVINAVIAPMLERSAERSASGKEAPDAQPAWVASAEHAGNVQVRHQFLWTTS